MELIAGWGGQICSKCRELLSWKLQWLPLEVWQISLAVVLPGAVMPHRALPPWTLKLTTDYNKYVWLKGIGGKRGAEIIHNTKFQ